MIYTETASAKKLQPDSADADKEGFITAIASFKINIQPLGIEYQAFAPEGAAGKVYQAFTSETGIERMMIIDTAAGVRYKVLGVEKWQGAMGNTTRLNLLKPDD